MILAKNRSWLGPAWLGSQKVAPCPPVVYGMLHAAVIQNVTVLAY